MLALLLLLDVCHRLCVLVYEFADLGLEMSSRRHGCQNSVCLRWPLLLLLTRQVLLEWQSRLRLLRRDIRGLEVGGHQGTVRRGLLKHEAVSVVLRR